MPPQARPPWQWLWRALVAGCAALYLFGLGGSYAPTNGDEMVYIHIARMTAESGHWLPLQSELAGTRNTKPPLLIWQAMVAGGWGAHWSLFWLRLPSVLYTFATTALVGFFAWQLTRATSTDSNASVPGMGVRIPQDTAPAMARDAHCLRNACLAASLYLLYFSTFRYGRAYLTSAPETFWLALPLWYLLWLAVRPASGPGTSGAAPLPLHLSAKVPLPGWLVHNGFGVVMGLGAAYKSFALLAPAAATLWCTLLLLQWPLTVRPGKVEWKTLLQVSLKTGWSTAIGLAIFALWFVLDPDPAAVWQEFVVAENAGKMSSAQGYWYNALFGTYPMWTQLLAYPANAGLLFFSALGFCVYAIRRGVQRSTYAQLSRADWVLLLWLGLWLLIFTIPSQRSERYVIPAMPALAIAMALAWNRLGQFWHLVTLCIAAPALIMLARIGWVMGDMGIGSGASTALVVVLAGVGLLAVAVGFWRKAWRANATLVSCLSVLATFGAMVQPLSQAEVQYPPAVQQHMKGLRLAVPNGFTGQYERFHFVFPGARITPFDAEGRNTGALYPELPGPQRLERLLMEFDAVVWLQESLSEAGPACLPSCRVLGQRWHVKSRHQSGEITLQNLWFPQEWLFRTEWLIVPSAS